MIITHNFTNTYEMDSKIMAYQLECDMIEAKTNYVLEEVILFNTNESNIETFGLVQEKFTDKIKEVFRKLVENIAKMWGKFIEAVDNFFKSDNDYLAKYKDTILTKDLKEESYTMFPYWKGYQLLANSKIPAFVYNNLKASLGNEDEFINKHFNRFKPKNKDDNFKQVATTMFKGASEPVENKSAQINMTDIYNYCLDYNKNTKQLEKDIEEINKASQAAIKLIESEKAIKEDAYTLEKYFYSVVKESVILNEELVKKASSDNKTSGTVSSSSTDPNRKSTEVKNKDGDHQKTDKAYSDPNKVSKEQMEDDIKRIQLYMTTCTGFLGVKMSVMQETYKAYMFIIRDHIKSYAGEKKDSSPTNAAKSATDNSVKNDGNTSKKGKLESIFDKIKPKSNKKEKD